MLLGQNLPANNAVNKPWRDPTPREFANPVYVFVNGSDLEARCVNWSTKLGLLAKRHSELLKLFKLAYTTDEVLERSERLQLDLRLNPGCKRV
jgi:hypothetical protein